ncbi:MAG: phosphoenolpyruvate carboxykinase (ATP) [Desulfarculales bacterium]|nr:phosphoenolpyruvate carboxykinase (ATP) [Desulfarculales bacterium]
MSSKPSCLYYKELSQMSPVRAMAESLFNSRNSAQSLRRVTAPELYEMACRSPHSAVTDLPMDRTAVARLGLKEDAKVFNWNHGDVVGRSAEARVFYNRISPAEKTAVQALLREALYELQSGHRLVFCEAVVGTHPDMMIKARLLGPEEDAANMFAWLANFNPLEAVPQYETSKLLHTQDILFVAYPAWTPRHDYLRSLYPDWYKDPQNSRWRRGCVVVDEKHKTIYNLGLRYFGERKKGTLTMAWTAGMDMGAVAAHASIKEIDLSACQGYQHRGKQIISFYGLSGSGKSSHANSRDNGGTLPSGFKAAIAHDDAFQIDYVNRKCYVWEPSLFDKTDSRDPDSPDWKYCICTQNMAVCQTGGKIVPYGRDLRNNNGRAIFSRELLGETVNVIGFPHHVCWLMKDSTLPPIMRLTNPDLAVTMGATLMTKRTAAENISAEEMKKLVFMPFANPFRVYELWRDCIGYHEIFNAGAAGYVWNSGGSGMWKNSDAEVTPIPLSTSLALQTALLTGRLTWEDYPYIDGAQIPSRESIEKILPGYYETYSPAAMGNLDGYKETLRDRFQQRRDFLINSDIKEKPELLARMVGALKTTV